MDGSNILKPLCNTYQTISYPFLLSPKLTVKIRFSSNSVICYISLVISFSWFMTSCLLVLGQFKAISSLRIPRARGHLDNCLIAHFPWLYTLFFNTVLLACTKSCGKEFHFFTGCHMNILHSVFFQVPFFYWETVISVPCSCLLTLLVL